MMWSGRIREHGDRCSCWATISIPMVTGSRWSRSSIRRMVGCEFGSNVLTTRPTPGSPGWRRSPTRSGTRTGLRGRRCGAGVGRYGAWWGGQSPVLDVDYLVVYQGSSVGFTAAQLLANDDDPQGEALTVVAVSEPGDDGVLAGSLATGFTYTPTARAAFVGTDQSTRLSGGRSRWACRQGRRS